MLVGSDESNYKTVEAAIGRKVDIIRAYRYRGTNHKTLLDLAAAGYGVWASYKFRDTKTGTIPATSVTSHAIDADLDAFDQTMEQLTRDGVRGPHRKGYEHEEDAKAAAASGNPTQLNAAVTYCIDRRKTQAKAAGLQTFQCWTGYDLLLREPLYRVSGNDVDVIMLDPYAGNLPGPSMVASYGQDLNYLRTIYKGKPVCFGEVNAPNTGPAGSQAAWLNQARHDLEAQYPEVDGACLWQGGDLSESAPELALMKDGFFAATPDLAAQLAAAQARISDLAGQLATANGNLATATASNAKMQAAIAAAQSDLARLAG
jgi:hypothetical protein